MDSNRVDEMTERAAQSLAAGEPLRALALADQLVSINPEDATARVIRSHALMATHSVDEAFREAQVAVLFDAESEDAQMAFALAAWRSRKISLAQQAFERAVGLCRHRGPFEAQYAWFQASELDAKSAERTAERIVGTNPRSATAWAALGLAQFRLNKSEDASRSLKRAFEIDPRSPEAQSAMVRLLKRRGETRQADALREVLQQGLHRHSFFVERPEELELAMSGQDPPTSESVRTSTTTQAPTHPWAVLQHLVMLMVILAIFLALYPRQPIVAFLFLGAALTADAILFWRRRSNA
jgi:Tfp pilus assembly protein PilF